MSDPPSPEFQHATSNLSLNSTSGRDTPLDFVDALILAAESSATPSEPSTRHTTPVAEDPTNPATRAERRAIGSQDYSGGRKETEPENSPENKDLLTSRWLTTKQLVSLEKQAGLIRKKGQFSQAEHQSIVAAIESYQERSGFDTDELERAIFQNEDEEFWTEIVSVVPNRPMMSVYLHVRRSYHPYGKLGTWHVSEDNDLFQAVMEHGNRWKAVSAAVGRSDVDCRDRYRNHVKHRNENRKGRWSVAEEDELTQIVNCLSRDSNITIQWEDVSARMDHRRGRQQCAAKWLELKRRSINGGRKRIWRRDHANGLIAEIREMDLVTDQDIDWETLQTRLQARFQNVWSTVALRRKWTRLKSEVHDVQNKTHQEIISILHATRSVTRTG